MIRTFLRRTLAVAGYPLNLFVYWLVGCNNWRQECHQVFLQLWRDDAG